jgi:hypothetical protein
LGKVIGRLERFPIQNNLPVEAGCGPFHIRGLYFHINIRHAQTVPGGLDAVLARLNAPETAAFLRQSFKWHLWYDVFPAVPLLYAVSSSLGEPHYEFLERRGYEVGKEDIPRVFRTLLGLGRPGSLFQKLPAFASANLDFGSVMVDRPSPNTAYGEHRGVPSYFAPTFGAAMAGFIRGALELEGAQNARLTHLDVLSDGSHGGFELSKIQYGFGWD